MNRYRHFMNLCFLLGLLSSQAWGKEPAGNPLDTYEIYTFEVTIAGETAKLQKKGDLFAVLQKPVKPDALLSIAKKADMLIVNATLCNPDGSVPNGGKTHAMFAQNVNQLKLNATLDKKVLTPGLYLMNVVAHNRTSRVVFKVADPAGKIKMPTFGQVMDFLRGKK